MSNLRAEFLRFNPFREKIIEVELPTPDGEDKRILKVKLKQPTVATRNKIANEAKEGNIARAQAIAVLECALNPDTGARMFEDTDLGALEGLPCGSWLDTLSAEAMALIDEANDAAKKSEQM